MFSAKTNAKWNAKESYSKLNKIFEINIPYETFTEWSKENIENKVVPGFRKGKAPLSSLKEDWALSCVRAVAAEIIETEQLKNVFNSTYALNHFALGEEIKITLNIDLYPSGNILFCSEIASSNSIAETVILFN